MKPLILFLERYKNLQPANQELIGMITNSIKDNTGCNLPISAIKYQNGLIYITTTPLVRGEILMKKDHILKQIRALVSGTIIKNIR